MHKNLTTLQLRETLNYWTNYCVKSKKRFPILMLLHKHDYTIQLERYIAISQNSKDYHMTNP